MAVTLVVLDLIYPIGDLQPALFPKANELEESVARWLQEAAANANVTALSEANANTAAKHWVYYRAYQAVAQRLAMQPTNEQRDNISRSWGQNRIDYFTKLSADNKAVFDSVTTVASYSGLAMFARVKAGRVTKVV